MAALAIAGSSAALRLTASPPQAQLPPAPAPGRISTTTAPAGFGYTILAAFARLAVARAKRGPITPIPLDAGDGVVRGWLMTDYLIDAVRARQAMLAGAPLDETNASALFEDQARLSLAPPVAIAFPLRCGNATAPVLDVTIVTAEGTSTFIRTSPLLSAGALSSRLPTLTLPVGAVARSYFTATTTQNIVVQVTYGEGCDGQPRRVSLPVTFAQPQDVRPHMSVYKFPPEVTLTSTITVQVRGIVDEAGVFIGVVQMTGPRELEPASLAAPANWKFRPGRVNGVPHPAVTTQAVSFSVTGPPLAK